MPFNGHPFFCGARKEEKARKAKNAKNAKNAEKVQPFTKSNRLKVVWQELFLGKVSPVVRSILKRM